MPSSPFAPHRFGAQVWLEPSDSPERVDRLFRRLQEAGMGWARLFLMWPWIEPRPGEWNFALFDAAFDAAAAHRIRIKATLTANSGPWHIGTPSMLHSHTGVLAADQRPAMDRYIDQCVERYHPHPACAQWILWNEPFGRPVRTETALDDWRAWLRDRFGGALAQLNDRWRTGYASFDEIPFPEAVPHPEHANENWNSYGPWLLDWQFRAARVVAELQRIRERVRRIDPEAEIVINPNQVIANHASSATDLGAMAELADVLGASFHPAWHFTHAPRHEFSALIATGVQFLRRHAERVEITELQFGNTVNSSLRPSAARPRELTQWLLAGLAAGAEQAIGWCLNVRSRDFEAGDWGLLDNDDEPSPRSEALRDLSHRIAVLEAEAGPLGAAEPEIFVLVDTPAQALEWVEAHLGGGTVPGRQEEDAARGASRIAALGAELGRCTTLSSPARLPSELPPGTLLVASHLVALEPGQTRRLLELVERGATLLLDGTTGRKSHDAALHRPWPVGLEAAGLSIADLESDPEGFVLKEHGRLAGHTILTRARPRLSDPAWKALGSLRFADDASPALLARPLGKGRLVLFRGLLGPSLQHAPDFAETARGLLATLAEALPDRPRPALPRPGAMALPCRLGAEEGLLLLQAEAMPGTSGGPPPALRLRGLTGPLTDVWAGLAIVPDALGEASVPLPEGIALLRQARA